MTLTFVKYQGTGNDFVLCDNRAQKISLTAPQIAKLCHRRFGIGADGFILLEKEKSYDFKMVYYNSDGRESSMCGNGGRCVAHFASRLGIGDGKSYAFSAIDGGHHAEVKGNEVTLSMNDTEAPGRVEEAWFVDTGSPHHIIFHDEPEVVDILPMARAVRYSDGYKKEGVNVNFVKTEGDKLFMRTYERGVEDETYSCGTGVTAAALVAHAAGKTNAQKTTVETRGGMLGVEFSPAVNGGYQQIKLTGPVEVVYEGHIEL